MGIAGALGLFLSIVIHELSHSLVARRFGALALFNFIPAFPLDGGRVLRSAIWNAKKNLRYATRVTSWIGSAFAFVLIAWGVFNFLRGSFIGGMWWFLIGLFLNNAARSSYQQLIVRQALEGEKVRRFMEKNPISVKGALTLQELVEDYIYQYHFKMFPVVENTKKRRGSYSVSIPPFLKRIR